MIDKNLKKRVIAILEESPASIGEVAAKLKIKPEKDEHGFLKCPEIDAVMVELKRDGVVKMDVSWALG